MAFPRFCCRKALMTLLTVLPVALTFTIVYYYYASLVRTSWTPKDWTKPVVDSPPPGNSSSTIIQGPRDSQIVHTSWPPNDWTKYLQDSSSPTTTSYRTKDSQHVHKILLFNPAEWLSRCSKATKFSQCPVGNCMVHEDRTKLSESAAVVFSISDNDLGSAPPVSFGKRNPDQAWIMLSIESSHYIPVFHHEYLQPEWKSAFNWTMTHRKDADIYLQYRILEKRKPPVGKNYSKIFREKKKFAAWLVSHCRTQSRRMDYVKMLQKYVSVDVYGGCGKRLQNNSRISYENIFDQDYRFYLGFENSLCPGYITEKYYQMAQLDLVVVVRGGSDYNATLTKNTFINTEDFPSVKSLADYLIQLASNEAEYISYLKAKDEFYIPGPCHHFQVAYCDMCEKLNSIDKHRKTVDDIVKWVRQGQCRDPTDLKDI